MRIMFADAIKKTFKYLAFSLIVVLSSICWKIFNL